MADRPLLCALLSDFNIEPLANYLAHGGGAPVIQPRCAPFGQALAVLADPAHDVWSGTPDAAVIWTRPEVVSEGYRDLLRCRDVPVASILEEVDAYAALLLAARARARALLVPTWSGPARSPASLLAAMRAGGPAHVLLQMNSRLAEACAAAADVHLLDCHAWLARAAGPAHSASLWYLAKVPFSHTVLKEAAGDIRAALRGITGSAKKLIVVDLDDTLWGGLVGEIGWEHLRVGGHDAAGEAYADFQRALKALKDRGILLAIASKNDEARALQVFDAHPEMILRRDDFAAWRIDWSDKAAHIAAIAEELNLGLDAVVFIDDSPAERGRVREALPEVLVPEWPEDPMAATTMLLSLGCFESPARTAEDAGRTALYAEERRRESERPRVGSLESWLRGLDMSVVVEAPSDASMPRIVQLFNKTNQMNLSTRRVTEEELRRWLAGGGRALWSFRVRDRYGDSGLTGVLALDAGNGAATITDFIVSCRVLGRRLEETMISVAVEHARDLGVERVTAKYVPTDRNAPCLEFLRRSGFTLEAPDLFHWDARRPYPAPDCVRIDRKGP